MNIGLIDMDGSHFPNLALMKISSYHKTKGDNVEWYCPMTSQHKDIVYISKIFTFKDDFPYEIKADKVIKGGTGYDIKSVLPTEIENCKPDYSIYPNIKYAIGFLSRGCIRQCKECVVPLKEGNIRFNDTWENIKRDDSNNILFLDNNFLACKKAVKNLETMKGYKINFDFNQGLDCRLFTDEHACLLSELKIKTMAGRSGKFIKGIRFSCDRKEQMPYIEKAVQLMSKYGYKAGDFNIYMLLTNDYNDAVYRLNFLKELGVCVNAQPFRDLYNQNLIIPKWQKAMANYTFKKASYKSHSWEEHDW